VVPSLFLLLPPAYSVLSSLLFSFAFFFPLDAGALLQPLAFSRNRGDRCGRIAFLPPSREFPRFEHHPKRQRAMTRRGAEEFERCSPDSPGNAFREFPETSELLSADVNDL
jgi:hypothetical protein